MSARANDWRQGLDCDADQGGKLVPDRASASETAVAAQAARWVVQAWQLLSPVLLRLWARVEARRVTQRRRSLRVMETVGMGEKRFVAIVQVQDARFLIGGGAAGVSLLARLDREQEFAAVLDEKAAPPASSISECAAKIIPEAW